MSLALAVYPVQYCNVVAGEGEREFVTGLESTKFRYSCHYIYQYSGKDVESCYVYSVRTTRTTRCFTHAEDHNNVFGGVIVSSSLQGVPNEASSDTKVYVVSTKTERSVENKRDTHAMEEPASPASASASDMPGSLPASPALSDAQASDVALDARKKKTRKKRKVVPEEDATGDESSQRAKPGPKKKKRNKVLYRTGFSPTVM